jgi:HD superfamily phosphodiesterase
MYCIQFPGFVDYDVMNVKNHQHQQAHEQDHGANNIKPSTYKLHHCIQVWHLAYF